MTQLLARAAQYFEAAECYLSSGESFEVTVHQGEIKAYNVSTSVGLGFRAMTGGRVGYASTQVLDEAAIDQLITGARENAQLIEREEAGMLFPGAQDYPAPNGFHPALEEVSAARKIEAVLALDRTARSIDPRVTQLSDCGLFSSRSALSIVNSLGLDVSYEENGIGYYVTPVAREGDAVSAPMTFRYGHDFEALSIEALAQDAVGKAVKMLGAAPVPSGDVRVVLSAEAASDFLKVFAPAFSADNAQKGLSLLSGREGETVASAAVTVIDDPLMPAAPGGAPFDGEGVPSRAKPVIERGVLKTLLHNLETAHRAGVETTGNAARGSYGGPVTVAPTNFFIAPGADDLAALLQAAGDGLFITEIEGLHSGANAVSGAFSLSARGFKIEHGALGRAVNGITVAGNFFDVIKQVERVGHDLWFGLPGTSCFGSPSMFVGYLKIAGT